MVNQETKEYKLKMVASKIVYPGKSSENPPALQLPLRNVHLKIVSMMVRSFAKYGKRWDRTLLGRLFYPWPQVLIFLIPNSNRLLHS